MLLSKLNSLEKKANKAACFSFLAAFFILVGGLFRLLFLAQNRPFHMDEGYLACDILTRSPVDILSSKGFASKRNI